VRLRVDAGAAVARVHVVIEPLTEYLRFELASYAPNVDAGEDVRILPVRPGEAWPVDIPDVDFWMVDSRGVWEMSYAKDGHLAGCRTGDRARPHRRGVLRPRCRARRVVVQLLETRLTGRMTR